MRLPNFCPGWWIEDFGCSQLCVVLRAGVPIPSHPIPVSPPAPPPTGTVTNTTPGPSWPELGWGILAALLGLSCLRPHRSPGPTFPNDFQSHKSFSCTAAWAGWACGRAGMIRSDPASLFGSSPGEYPNLGKIPGFFTADLHVCIPSLSCSKACVSPKTRLFFCRTTLCCTAAVAFPLPHPQVLEVFWEIGAGTCTPGRVRAHKRHFGGSSRS